MHACMAAKGCACAMAAEGCASAILFEQENEGDNQAGAL